MKPAGALRRLLDHPRMGIIAAAVGTFFLLPSLGAGLAGDDYFHWLRATGALGFGSRLSLFNFFDGSPEAIAAVRDRGLAPWFAEEKLRLDFFRPLTGITHYVDYTVWPHAPWLMHAENLAINAALIFATAVLYRKLLAPRWVAGLAALLYALDVGHGFAGWVAGRNGILSAAFGVAAIAAHVRWRRDGWKAGAWLAPLLLALGLLAGEAAVATLAYFFAYALTLDRAALRARIFSLLPGLGVVGAWQALYRALGCGAFGSGLYLDPGRQPLLFLVEAPGRAIALLLGELALVPPEVYVFLGPRRPAFLAMAALFLACVLAVIAPLLYRSARARFFGLGALFSLVPVCATFPSGRLLLFVGVGAMGLVAEVAGRVFADGEATTSGFRERSLAWLWLGLHLLLAVPLLLVASVTPMLMASYTDRSATGLPTLPQLADRIVVVVNTPNLLPAIYRFVVPRNGVFPDHTRARVLSVSRHPVHVRRVDASTIDVSADDDLLGEVSSSLVRGDAFPMTVGEVTELPGMQTRVEEVTATGHPRRVTFHFDHPLEAKDFFWVGWQRARFVAITLPPVGEEIPLNE